MRMKLITLSIMIKKYLFLLLSVILSACSGGHMDKPLIGISSGVTNGVTSQLGDSYIEAVTLAGGVPVIIPTVRNDEEAARVVAAFDGIIFSGGEDVQPSYYSEAVLNETVKWNIIRDVSDIALARAALAQKKPILGICRGSQLMNVAMGGTLYQDIPTQLPDAVRHSRGASHMIGLDHSGFLYRIYGSDSLMVNSFHHQGVKDPAPSIKIVARSADGFVEAFESGNVWGVQFHPEKMIQSGDHSWVPLFSEWMKGM